MVRRTSYMFVTGPDVVKTVTHEDVTKEELGGAITHNATSGVAHFAVDDDRECLALVRDLLSYLPSNNVDPAPVVPSADPADREDESLDTWCRRRPTSPTTRLVRAVVTGEFLEVHEQFARNRSSASRAERRDGGVVANQPAHLAGTLDIDASVKGARFVRFCDAFGIPLVTFEDVPGFLPGVNRSTAASSGTVRSCCTPMPRRPCRRSRITRKAHGGAYCVMASKHIRTDANFAWPTAEIAVMGPEGAVNILHKRELDQAEDPAAVRPRASPSTGRSSRTCSSPPDAASSTRSSSRGRRGESSSRRSRGSRTSATGTRRRSTATFRSRQAADGLLGLQGTL